MFIRCDLDRIAAVVVSERCDLNYDFLIKTVIRCFDIIELKCCKRRAFLMSQISKICTFYYLEVECESLICSILTPFIIDEFHPGNTGQREYSSRTAPVAASVKIDPGEASLINDPSGEVIALLFITGFIVVILICHFE